jgi:hypothetical protein
MLRNRGTRNRQAARNFANRARSIAQALEDGPPGRIVKSGKGSLSVSHYLRLVNTNHLVKPHSDALAPVSVGKQHSENLGEEFSGCMQLE